VNVHLSPYLRVFWRQFTHSDSHAIATSVTSALSPVHTSDYRGQSPVLATVAEFGDYNRQCGQGLRGYFYKEMRYINLRFTYLLTYLFIYLLTLLFAPKSYKHHFNNFLR